MGEFRSGGRGGFGDRDSPRREYGRGGFGNRGGFRDRESGGFNRRPPEMHEATCSKCGKRCEVPFRPRGDKPVYCSDCFKNHEGSGGRSQGAPQSGISSEQFSKLNAKLDKIIQVLESLELDVEGEEEEAEEEEEVKEEEK